MTTTPIGSHPQGTAATAADETRHVAGVASDEARSVVAEARDQARQLFDETMHQLDEQGSVQRDRVVELLRTLSSDLHRMAESSPGSAVAGSLVREGADRTDDLTKVLDGRDLSDLVEEVRGFARRRPGTFLLGALAAGVVAGRFVRGSKAAHGDSGPAEEMPATTTPGPTYLEPPLDGADPVTDGSSASSPGPLGER